MEIEKLIKKYLSKFDFYKDGQPLIMENEKELFISYREKDWNPKTEQIRFDIQIHDGICDINYLQIRMDLKRRGYGRRLVDVIEKFCEEIGEVKLMRVTSSGEGDYFWPKMGFVDLKIR